MATKPTNTVLVRASDANYTTGPVPLQTKPTKINPDIATPGTSAEGHKVDSPLGTFTVEAQGENYFNNITDLFTEWTKAGSTTGAADAHIVETDGTGKSNIRNLNIVGTSTASPLVVNLGTGPTITATGSASGPCGLFTAGPTQNALSLVSSATASALLVVQTNTVNSAVRVDASGDIALDVNHSKITGDGVNVVCAGDDSVAVNATAQDGAVFEGTSNGNGVVLQINPVTTDPTVFPGDVGGIWSVDTTTKEADYIGVRLNGQKTFVHTSRTKYVWAYGESLSATVTGVGVFHIVAASFDAKAKPNTNSRVFLIVSIRTAASIEGSTDLYGTIDFHDTTAGGGPLRTVSVYESNGVNNFRDHYWRIPYTLPAGGARSFSADLSAINGSTISFVDFLFSVESNPE